jgi:hypothetical protein
VTPAAHAAVLRQCECLRWIIAIIPGVSSPIRTLPHNRVLSGLPVICPELLAMSPFEIGYTDKCQKNHKTFDSPQRERASHHLLERMLAMAGQTTLEIIATSNEMDASL